MGFVFQTSAVVVSAQVMDRRADRQFESSRLVMIQVLLQGLKMDPLCSLHYYAPVSCAPVMPS